MLASSEARRRHRHGSHGPVRGTRDRTAHRPAAPDRGLHRHHRAGAGLSPYRARDRRGRGADVVLERPCAAREPRAPRPPDQGPDQAPGHDALRRQPRRGRRRPARGTDRGGHPGARRPERRGPPRRPDGLRGRRGALRAERHGRLDGRRRHPRRRRRDRPGSGDRRGRRRGRGAAPGAAEDEATVKRLRRQRGKVVLVPENPAMEPFDMDPEGRILGKVVAVLRKL